jgi:hypothetical protein
MRRSYLWVGQRRTSLRQSQSLCRTEAVYARWTVAH